jgi:DNA-binding IclR family transcriptional regulator
MATQSSVERALALLQYLARHPGEHGVRPLAGTLAWSPSTTYRLLETLTQAGFVHQNALTDKYSIGVAAVQLGISALGTLDVTRVAPPCLRDLVAETGESAFLAVLDDAQVVYLLKQEGQYAIRTTARLGSRRPLHCTGLGKALLAGLPVAEALALLRQAGLPAMTPHTITDPEVLLAQLVEVRERGYATDHEEVEEGLACVAAPVRDYSGATIAAVSMAGPVARVLPHEEQFGRRVAAAARQISTALGYVPD